MSPQSLPAVTASAATTTASNAQAAGKGVAPPRATAGPTPGSAPPLPLPAGRREPLVGGAPHVGTREHWLAGHVHDCACGDCYHARAADADAHDSYVMAIEGDQ